MVVQKRKTLKPEELFTNNDIGFTIIVEDGRGITKDSRINHINDYIGDQYIKSKRIMIQFIIMILFKLL